MTSVHFYPDVVTVQGLSADRHTVTVWGLSAPTHLVLKRLIEGHTIELGSSDRIGTVRTKRSHESIAEARITHSVHCGPRGAVTFRRLA